MASPSTAADKAVAAASASPTTGPPVFIDTNLETHLAMVVCPDDTVANLKRKVSIEHALCFPDIGEISVTAMKVRRRASLYHLSDSMLARSAFEGIKGIWFLHMDVSPTSSVVKGQMGSAENVLNVNCERVENISHLVQTEPGDSNIEGGGIRWNTCGVTNGPLAEKNLIQSEPSSVPVESSLPHVGKDQTPNLHAPLTDQHFDVDKHVEVSINVMSRGKELCDGSENFVDPERHVAVYEGDGVVASDVHHKIDMLIDQMEKDVREKDSVNVHYEVNDNTSIVPTKKGKSRKRNEEVASDHLLNILKPSSGKKRHKKEKEKEKEKDSCFKDNIEDFSKETESENVLPEKHSDRIEGNLDILGELCGNLLNRNLVDGKKKKKRRRKQSSECNNETDAAVTFGTSDSREKPNSRTGLSDQRSDENGSALGKEVIKENSERSFGDNAKDLGADSAMEFHNEDTTENATQGNRVEVGSEVPLKPKRNSRRSRKKQVKEDVPSYEPSEYELVHSSGKQVTEENAQEALANGSKDPDIEPIGKIIREDASGLRNVAEVVLEVPSNIEDRSSHRSRKKSGKTESTKSKSGKDVDNGKDLGKESGVVGVLEEAAALRLPERVDSEVPPNTNNKNSCSNKTRSFKMEVSNANEHSISHSSGKQTAEVNPDVSLANDHRDPSKELDATSILEEAAAFGNAGDPSKELDEANTTVRISNRSKKKAVESKSSHCKSNKNDDIHSPANHSTQEKLEGALGNRQIVSYSKSGIPPEEAAQILALRNLVQVDSTGLSGHTSSKYETLHSSERQVSQDNPKEDLGNTHGEFHRELSAELPCEDDSHIASPRNLAGKSEADKHVGLPDSDNEKVNFKDFFIPKSTRHGVVTPEGADTTMETNTTETHKEKPTRSIKKFKAHSQDKSSDLAKISDDHHQHKRKAQGGDSGNHNLTELIKEPALKQKRKSQKQKTDKRLGRSDMALGDASYGLGSPKSSRDHQMSEQSPQGILSGIHLPDPPCVDELNNPDHHSARNTVSNALKTCASVSRQQIEVGAGASTKEINAAPAASSDSTEEDTPHVKKRYRVAVRKVPKYRFHKVADKSAQGGALLNPSDNIFGHVMSASSDDELEINKRKATSKNVSDSSTTSADSEGDLNETQVIRPPRDKKYMDSLGAQPSAAYGVNDKETSGDDIVLSQSSKAAKKGMTLGMLLRNSSSYRKAKLTASQSQNDDTESQSVDVVLETQPDSL